MIADDDIGGNSSSIRRAVTDPPARAANMDERASQDREAAPRVRFSQDLDRATAAAVSATQRPGAPDLSIDTGTGIRSSSDGPRPVASVYTRKAANPVSPTSPRTRDRGYSLRRTLFARGISSQSVNSPIELAEAGPSSSQDDLPEGQDAGKAKQNNSSVTIYPGKDNDAGISHLGSNDQHPDPASRSKEKKQFGTLSLPNYDVWARRTSSSNSVIQKVKRWKKQATNIIMRRTEIPPSKDGRHIELDAARRTTLIDERTGHAYCGNAIRSSRYTIWNFVPRQLFFQFSKLANAYFLLVSILQMVPGLSTTGNYTTIAPLLVFVAISMGKEGYDE